MRIHILLHWSFSNRYGIHAAAIDGRILEEQYVNTFSKSSYGKYPKPNFTCSPFQQLY